MSKQAIGNGRLSAALLGVAGVVLFASLFMPWYGVNPHQFLILFGAPRLIRTIEHRDSVGSAWRVFSVADIGLAAIAVYLVGLGAAIARGLRRSRRAAVVVGLPVVAALAFVIVRIVDRPNFTALYGPHLSGAPAMDLKYGAVVALAGLVVGTVGLLVEWLHRAAAAA